MGWRSKRLLAGTMVAAAALLVPAGVTGFPAAQNAQAASATPVYKDPKAPVDTRVEDLLRRMTLPEKIAQITTVWDSKVEIFDSKLQLDRRKLRRRFPEGIGQFARPSDARGPVSPRVQPWRSTAETVALVNGLQRWAVEETRLGIPILFHEEGLHGYAALGATSFPQAIAMASSFDPEMVRRVNQVIAREIRARGVHLALSPVVDIVRDPRWGRFEETFGEDPHLAGEMGVAAVQGLQGEGSVLGRESVWATLKHLTGHGQPESGTNVGPAPISERELRENFFPPFEEVVRRTEIRAVMPSYNEIDGIPSHANKWLLTDVLRGEWGFRGAVVSDYYAIDQLAELHKVEPNREAAAIRALNAGVDSDLPDGGSYRHLLKAVREGQVSEEQINTAVRRMLELKFRAGLFENPYGDVQHATSITNNQEARGLALEAARRSLILLKNDGMLPLAKPEPGRKPTIAVIGPSANVARLGGYYGIPPQPVSLLDGLRTKLGTGANIVFAQGVKITENDDWWADEVKLADPAANRALIQQAVQAARGADSIILTLGDTEQTSREAWADAHLGDRSSLSLVGEQQQLFDALRALGKPITVVLVNGRPPAIERIVAEANAIIEAWYPGEQGGNALADVLFGDVNPGGKLPVTFPRNAGQIPAFYNHKPSARRGYLFDDVKPLFPFGWGLSYTSFEMSAPRLSDQQIGPGGNVEVAVDVRNSGRVAGDEVVQIYVRDKVSSVTRPVKELKAFQRVTLAPGERKTVRLTLTPRAFHMWNDRMERVVEPGEFEIMAGPNSVDLKTATLRVTG
jgi:beta-glucosidase